VYTHFVTLCTSSPGWLLTSSPPKKSLRRRRGIIKRTDSPIVGSFQVPVNLNESSLSLFDTTPYNAISVPSVPATFKVVSTGTTKQKPLLVSSDGFSYSVKTVRPTSTLWHCTKRSRQCPCKATVLQRNAEFSVGAHQHCHEPEPGVATVAQVRADVVAKTTQNIYASAAACVDVTWKNTWNTKYDYALRHPNDEVHRVTKWVYPGDTICISSPGWRSERVTKWVYTCCSYAFIGTHTHRQCCRYYSDAWHLECLVVNWLSTVSGHACWWWCRQLNRHMSRVHSSRVSLQDADEASNASTGSARSSSSVSQLQCRSETR